MRAHQGIPRAEALGDEKDRSPDEAAEGLSTSTHPEPAKEEAPGRLMPATIGFAAGLLVGKMGSSKPKRLILGAGGRIVQTPQASSTARRGDEDLVRRFREGGGMGGEKARGRGG